MCVNFLCWLPVLPPLRSPVPPLSQLVPPPLPPPLPLMQTLLLFESVSLDRLLALALVCAVLFASASSRRLLALALVFVPSELAASPPLATLALDPPSELVLALLLLTVSLG